MPLDLNCPKCRHVFPVTEARSAIAVQCPSCEVELTAEFRKRPTPVPGQHPYELFVSTGRPANASPLLPKKKRSGEPEEMQRGGSMAVVLFAGLGALFIAVGGLGAVGYFLFTNLDTSDSTLNSASNNRRGGTTSKGGPIDGNRGGGTPVIPTPDPIPDPNPNPNPWPPPVPPKPKDDFDLLPVAGQLQQITPPPLDLSTPKAIPLGGRAGAVSVGGNGRYIVFHLPEQRRLALFDASKGTVQVGPDQADAGHVLLAAGQNRVVARTQENILRVYTLPDLKRLYDASGPQLVHPTTYMVMGSATNGPLLAVNPFGDSVLIDVTEGSATPIEGSRKKIGDGIISPVRVSADGKLFVRGGFGTRDKAAIFTEFGRQWRITDTEIPNAYPAPDGRYIYGFGMIATSTGRPIGKTAAVGPGNGIWHVPAVHGTHFLRLAEVKEGNKQAVSISVHRSQIAPDREKAIFLGVLPETDGLVNWFLGNTLPLDQHLFLIPSAKLLVVLPASKDKLVLRKVEIR